MASTVIYRRNWLLIIIIVQLCLCSTQKRYCFTNNGTDFIQCEDNYNIRFVIVRVQGIFDDFRVITKSFINLT